MSHAARAAEWEEGGEGPSPQSGQRQRAAATGALKEGTRLRLLSSLALPQRVLADALVALPPLLRALAAEAREEATAGEGRVRQLRRTSSSALSCTRSVAATSPLSTARRRSGFFESFRLNDSVRNLAL